MNVSFVADRYGRLATVMATAWILILSGIVLIDYVHWRRLASLTQTTTASDAVKALGARVTALEGERSAQKYQPAPVTAERFVERTGALEGRLTSLEQGSASVVSQQVFATLATRVAALEAVRTHAVQLGNPTATRKANTPARDSPTEPPFRLLGFEMRGGASFLAIAPAAAVSLGEMSVLRVGDVQDGWQLEALDSNSATFRFQGKSHRLEIP